MRRARLALVAVASLLTTCAVPIAAHAAAGPTYAITSPATGSTWTGPVTITAVGDTDPSEPTDEAYYLFLYVNGAQYGGAATCTVSPTHCDATFSWDSTGLNGTYVLTVQLETKLHRNLPDSAPVTVTAANPAPTVAITSPAPNAPVKGKTLSVGVTGTVELAEADQPVSLQLLVDGQPWVTATPCTVVVTNVKTCTATLSTYQPSWGTHSLQVVMTTQRTSATSAVVPYLAWTPTKTVLTKVKPGGSGKSVVIKGRVTDTSIGLPLSRSKLTITVVPAVGRKKTYVIKTGQYGTFALTTKLAMNSTVIATAAATESTGKSHASTKVAVTAPILCKADLTVRHGRIGVGTCTVAHLPDGTKVALEYQSKKKWHVLGSGPTKGTDILISYKFGAPGRYPVRIVLGANKVYAATNGTPFTVVVS